MRVAREARDEMPVQVRRHVAETREIDFVRREHRAQRLLDGEHDAHAMRALRGGKVGHFLDVGIPDDAAVTGVIRVIHDNHAAKLVAPQDGAAIFRAELAM